jgi:ethanolamine permease
MGQAIAPAKAPLRARDVWALGVGIVVCGQYFGWNAGLAGNGPVALLIASLLVCLLFAGWVLMLTELAVAMPSAGGPLDYGTRAGGRWLGFLMGWSMFLECLFGGVATSLAAGGYVAFLIDPSAPSKGVAVAAGLATVGLFFLLQAWGVREQARALALMIYAALLALLVFWAAAGAAFSGPNVWPSSPLPAGKGWGAVIDALPYALWWLIIIEGAALCAEDCHRPQRSLPRGLTWAVLTVTAMVVLTTLTACGAVPSDRIAAVDYPLAEVVRRVPAGAVAVLVYGFGAVAVFGLVASYHGLLYSAGRQLFALGRDGLVPGGLGRLHPRRRTPVSSLAACSVAVAGFVLARLAFDSIMTLAVLVAGFAALVLYLLSMGCLIALRRREGGLFHAYRAPLRRGLPAAVIVLSLVALAAYPRMDRDGVLPLALGVYAAGLVYVVFLGRGRGAPAPGPSQSSPPPRVAASGRLDRLAAVALVAGIAAAAWITLGALAVLPGGHSPSHVEVGTVLGLIALALLFVAAVAHRQLRRE